MPLRKYWIVLLLHLTSQVHLTSAQQLTELKETHSVRINNPSLTEDLVQQLKRKLP